MLVLLLAGHEGAVTRSKYTDLQTKVHVLVTSAYPNKNRHLMALSKELISFTVFSSSASGTFAPCKRPSYDLHPPPPLALRTTVKLPVRLGVIRLRSDSIAVLP